MIYKALHREHEPHSNNNDILAVWLFGTISWLHGYAAIIKSTGYMDML
jgi:hypothetical protein